MENKENLSESQRKLASDLDELERALINNFNPDFLKKEKVYMKNKMLRKL